MITARKVLSLFLVTAVCGLAGALTFAPADASAKFNRYSAFSCQRAGFNFNWLVMKNWNFNSLHTMADGVTNRGGTAPVLEQLFCPIEDNDRFDKSAVNYVYVHGNDPAGAWPASKARACVFNWNVPSADCGDEITQAQAGEWSLQVPVAVFKKAANYADFAYIYVTLKDPGLDGGIGGSMRGYFVSE